MTPKNHLSPFAIFVLLTVSSGGIMFGYHTGILSGILPVLEKTFALSIFEQGFLVSIVLLGGLTGALIAGFAADKWGRKKVLVATAAIFCVGGLIQALAHNYPIMLTGRFLAGIGVGLSSVVSPMYLAEVAPSDYRGRFVSSYQFMLAGGILLAYAINVLFGQASIWRAVFYISLIPPFLQLVALLFVNESPSWLMSQGKKALAKRELAELNRSEEWDTKLADSKEIQKIEKKKGIDTHLKYILLIGILLSVFQQITGVNTVFYYAPKVLVASGAVSSAHSLGATFLIGIVNVLFTLVAIFFLDRLGRKIFLYAGVGAMLTGQILLALSPVLPAAGIIGVFLFVIGFAIGLGPVTWVLLSEIFPEKIRGRAMGASLFANWLANYLITLTFLFFLEKLGISQTFLMYGAISILCLLFIYFYIPETKGKSLEEIEILVKKGRV